MLTFLTLLALASPTPAQDDGAAPWWETFPAPSAALKLEVVGDDAQAPSLLAVMREYVTLTGQSLIADRETLGLLATTPTGLDRSLEVPAGDVQSFVETVLYQNQFVFELLRDAAPRVVVVRSLNTQARHTVRDRARFVPVEEIAQAQGHPAMIVSTVLFLEHLDVPQTSAALRSSIADPDTQQVLPMGPSHSMLITGFGPQVARTVTILRTNDEQTGRARVGEDEAPGEGR
jgi:hypothetical protein